MGSVPREYSRSGMTLSAALTDTVRSFPNKAERPDHILWNGLRVKSFNIFSIPPRGHIIAEVISRKGEVQQGFDLMIIVKGWIQLTGDGRVRHLRTWDDPQLEPSVHYRVFSRSRELRTWNVYKRVWSDGTTEDEYGTGNAGFWVEEVGPMDRVYHCSHGLAEIPDFELFVYRVRVVP